MRICILCQTHCYGNIRSPKKTCYFGFSNYLLLTHEVEFMCRWQILQQAMGQPFISLGISLGIQPTQTPLHRKRDNALYRVVFKRRQGSLCLGHPDSASHHHCGFGQSTSTHCAQLSHLSNGAIGVSMLQAGWDG